MTIEKMTYDLLERLEIIPTDDQAVTYRLAKHWLSIARNTAMDEYFQQYGKEIPPSMIKEIKCVQTTVNTDCRNCEEVIYELPYPVADYPGVSGVYQATTPKGRPIDGFTVGFTGLLKDSGFNNSITWSRAGDIVAFHRAPQGYSPNLYLIPASLDAFEDTDTFPAPSLLEDDIMEMAEKIGRRKMQSPIDGDNDGVSDLRNPVRE